ncbi:MAG TPA: hypothetical protein VNK43_01210 [Gemmatimonadales bacterium]|nr:hypothetical protein [Gemmatimonadales bacterium]
MRYAPGHRRTRRRDAPSGGSQSKYDFRVSPNFSVSPFVNYIRAFGAGAKLNDADIDTDVNPSILQFGVGVTWH